MKRFVVMKMAAAPTDWSFWREVTPGTLIRDTNGGVRFKVIGRCASRQRLLVRRAG